MATLRVREEPSTELSVAGVATREGSLTVMEAVVVTAGAWVDKLVDVGVPVAVTQEQPFHFKPVDNAAVNTLIAIITDRLKKGDTVGITGFGTFSVAKRAARKGRNPATGEAIKIAASKTPKFSAGATLKAAVNPTKKK